MTKIFSTAFLLFLQAIRESAGDSLNTFFMNCTDFGNLPIILFLIAMIYWSYDKKLGEYLLVALSFSCIANSFAKLTACVYRPWVADSKVHPYDKALETATGYFLPKRTHYIRNSIIYRIHH